jgi:RNA-directed DNA polymerase
MVLDGLEFYLAKLSKSRSEKLAMRINYVRYADDFIVTGSSKELLETTIKPLIDAFMAERRGSVVGGKNHHYSY